MGMGYRSRLLLIIAVVVVAVVLFVVRYFLIPRHFLTSYVMPKAIDYGFLYCNNHFIVIPGNSMVILRYHVHGDVTINGVVIYMAFPADLINATLNAFLRLPNPNNAMMLGVYVNGKLIAVDNDSSPILGLKTSVSIPYHYGNETVTFWQLLSLRNETHTLVEYTSYGVTLPTINLTPSDTLTVIIYSAVPYALPSCAMTNESSEVGLMVEEHWIGLIGIYGVFNATPTAEQLYMEGRYITEVPIIYVINVTGPISQLPQELTPGLLTNVRSFAIGYAPSFAIGQTLPPTGNG
ncbi:hypothetical protein [Vulcanisaeta distributa]|uniref:hypothetical protein n=1 Tax=Vulcanisaeta distributa TaxID=164451 RepID=UPI0006CF50BD|nr:hypothetical protein [Vulcanisaeta distributa]